MKNLLLVAITGLLFSSCSKDETTTPNNNNNTTTIPTDGWLMDGTKYTQVYSLRSESQQNLNTLDATSGNNTHSFAAHFKTLPTASGTYHIVAFVADSTATTVGQNIGNNDVIISGSLPLTSGGFKSYWSTGTEGKDATITVTGGKIKIEVPEVDVTDFTTTVKITGTMIEN